MTRRLRLSNCDTFVYKRISIGLLLVEPGHEDVSFAAILLPICPICIFPLQKWHSANESYQDCDPKRSIEGHPTCLYCASNKVNTPPEHGFSEVVRVSCVPPEAPSDELLFPGCFVSQVSLELLISDPLNRESDSPNHESDDVQPSHNVVLRVNDCIEGC